MSKNKAKTDKNEHEIEKRSKAGAGKQNDQRKLKKILRSPNRITKLHN